MPNIWHSSNIFGFIKNGLCLSAEVKSLPQASITMFTPLGAASLSKKSLYALSVSEGGTLPLSMTQSPAFKFFFSFFISSSTSAGVTSAPSPFMSVSATLFIFTFMRV